MAQQSQIWVIFAPPLYASFAQGRLRENRGEDGEQQNQVEATIWKGQSLAVLTERMLVLGQLLHASGYLPLGQRRILDVGCGKVLSSFLQWRAKEENLFGVDLLAERVAMTKQQFPTIHSLYAVRDASLPLCRYCCG